MNGSVFDSGLLRGRTWSPSGVGVILKAGSLGRKSPAERRRRFSAAPVGRWFRRGVRGSVPVGVRVVGVGGPSRFCTAVLEPAGSNRTEELLMIGLQVRTEGGDIVTRGASRGTVWSEAVLCRQVEDGHQLCLWFLGD